MTSSPSASAPPFYTLITRRTHTCHLSHSQITLDSPNYFTSAFSPPSDSGSGFAESLTRTIHLDRHPALLQLIVEHLSGYEILPLQRAAIPETWDMATGKRMLRTDAEYFGLDGLVRKLDEDKLDAAVRRGPHWDNLTEYLRFCHVPEARLSAIFGVFVAAGIYTAQELRHSRNVNLSTLLAKVEYKPHTLVHGIIERRSEYGDLQWLEHCRNLQTSSQ